MVGEWLLVIVLVLHAVKYEIIVSAWGLWANSAVFIYNGINMLEIALACILRNAERMGDIEVVQNAGYEGGITVAIDTRCPVRPCPCGRSDLLNAFPIPRVADVVIHEIPDVFTGLMKRSAFKDLGKFGRLAAVSLHHILHQLHGVLYVRAALQYRVEPLGEGKQLLIPNSAGNISY